MKSNIVIALLASATQAQQELSVARNLEYNLQQDNQVGQAYPVLQTYAQQAEQLQEKQPEMPLFDPNYEQYLSQKAPSKMQYQQDPVPQQLAPKKPTPPHPKQVQSQPRPAKQQQQPKKQQQQSEKKQQGQPQQQQKKHQQQQQKQPVAKPSTQPSQQPQKQSQQPQAEPKMATHTKRPAPGPGALTPGESPVQTERDIRYPQSSYYSPYYGASPYQQLTPQVTYPYSRVATPYKGQIQGYDQFGRPIFKPISPYDQQKAAPGTQGQKATPASTPVKQRGPDEVQTLGLGPYGYPTNPYSEIGFPTQMYNPYMAKKEAKRMRKQQKYMAKYGGQFGMMQPQFQQQPGYFNNEVKPKQQANGWMDFELDPQGPHPFVDEEVNLLDLIHDASEGSDITGKQQGPEPEYVTEAGREFAVLDWGQELKEPGVARYYGEALGGIDEEPKTMPTMDFKKKEKRVKKPVVQEEVEPVEVEEDLESAKPFELDAQKKTKKDKKKAKKHKKDKQLSEDEDFDPIYDTMSEHFNYDVRGHHHGSLYDHDTHEDEQSSEEGEKPHFSYKTHGDDYDLYDGDELADHHGYNGAEENDLMGDLSKKLKNKRAKKQKKSNSPRYFSDEDRHHEELVWPSSTPLHEKQHHYEQRYMHEPNYDLEEHNWYQQYAHTDAHDHSSELSREYEFDWPVYEQHEDSSHGVAKKARSLDRAAKSKKSARKAKKQKNEEHEVFSQHYTYENPDDEYLVYPYEASIFYDGKNLHDVQHDSHYNEAKGKKATRDSRVPLRRPADRSPYTPRAQRRNSAINETPMYVRPFLEDPIFLQPDDGELSQIHHMAPTPHDESIMHHSVVHDIQGDPSLEHH